MTDIRRSLLRGMSSIVSDLYGEPAKQNTATYKTADIPGPANPPALPAFTQLWKTADETIDWTDSTPRFSVSSRRMHSSRVAALALRVSSRNMRDPP